MARYIHNVRNSSDEKFELHDSRFDDAAYLEKDWEENTETSTKFIKNRIKYNNVVMTSSAFATLIDDIKAQIGSASGDVSKKMDKENPKGSGQFDLTGTAYFQDTLYVNSSWDEKGAVTGKRVLSEVDLNDIEDRFDTDEKSISTNASTISKNQASNNLRFAADEAAIKTAAASIVELGKSIVSINDTIGSELDYVIKDKIALIDSKDLEQDGRIDTNEAAIEEIKSSIKPLSSGALLKDGSVVADHLIISNYLTVNNENVVLESDIDNIVKYNDDRTSITASDFYWTGSSESVKTYIDKNDLTCWGLFCFKEDGSAIDIPEEITNTAKANDYIYVNKTEWGRGYYKYYLLIDSGVRTWVQSSTSEVCYPFTEKQWQNFTDVSDRIVELEEKVNALATMAEGLSFGGGNVWQNIEE